MNYEIRVRHQANKVATFLANRHWFATECIDTGPNKERSYKIIFSVTQ